MEKTIRIAHLMSDDKFIDRHISNQGINRFDNHFFYVKNIFTYTGLNKSNITYIKPGSASYKDFIGKASINYDIIIFYYLDVTKCKIVHKIEKHNLKFIWSFYGAEIYSLPSLRNNFLSSETQRLLKGNFKVLFKEIVKNAFNLLGIGNTYPHLLKKAIKKVDYFAWYSEEEYDYLNELLDGSLPQFLKLPVNSHLSDITPPPIKESKILIGNSRTHFNNHVDILNLLSANGYSGEVNVPFNYGTNMHYVKGLKRYAEKLNINIRYIESFIKYNDYISFVSRHSAAIYNSYRQLALGNIFIAITCGLKVYLSNKNPILKWLKNKRFMVFSIEDDLERDLKLNNLSLNPDLIQQNMDAYEMLSDETNNIEFCNNIKVIARQ